jgi:hypothetical protein
MKMLILIKRVFLSLIHFYAIRTFLIVLKCWKNGIPGKDQVYMKNCHCEDKKKLFDLCKERKNIYNYNTLTIFYLLLMLYNIDSLTAN